MTDYECEVCGATIEEAGSFSFVRDMIEDEDWEVGMRKKRPNGPVHVFCPEHTRDSECMRMSPEFYARRALARRRNND